MLQKQPQGEQDQFRAEHDTGRRRRSEYLAGVDGGCCEPSEGGPADESADVRRVADIGYGESDREVQDGQDQELADQGILPGEGAAAHRVTEHAAEETEDRAGSPYGGPVEGAEVEVGDAPGEPARQVEREETALSERLLNERAEKVQREHVKRQVDESRVQEHARQQEPHLATGDGGRHEGAPREHLGRLCNEPDVQRVTVALARDRDREVHGHTGAYEAERDRKSGEGVQRRGTY